MSWEKYRHCPHPSILALEPLEELQHSEYHGLMEHPDDVMDADFTPAGGEGNPFLHLGMHVADVKASGEPDADRGRSGYRDELHLDPGQLNDVVVPELVAARADRVAVDDGELGRAAGLSLDMR